MPEKDTKIENTPIAEVGKVVSLEAVSHDNWDMSVYAPGILERTVAGQFVHVRVGDGYLPLLRRPLSIGPSTGDVMRLIFTVRGEGTKLLAKKQPGEAIDLIGPLGNGFKLPPKGEAVVLVGGGIGIVPLLSLSELIKEDWDVKFLLGIRSRDFLPISVEEIEHRGIIVSSDDGSLGRKGFVTDMFKDTLDELEGQKIAAYACGPEPMARVFKSICLDRKIPAQVSLEVSMGCGVGACQSCAVKRADNNGYLLVCKDGPVFDANDVDLSAGKD